LKAEITITASSEVDDIADSNVNDSKETLIPLLEFLLIEDLYREYTLFRDSP